MDSLIQIMHRKGGNFLPQHASDYIKTLIAKRKLVDKNFSVQVMCDDLNLPKSTIDKFLTKQTSDTGWSNVSAMVVYLDGSLDELAGIQRKALSESYQQIMAEATKPVPSPPVSSATDPTVSLIMDFHRQEVQRLADQHATQLDRFRRLVDQGREALIAQHTTESAHMQAMSERALLEMERHRKSFEEGRDAWRKFAIVLMVVLVVGVAYVTWEFSNLYGGVTGYLLRQAGLISAAGGAI